MVMKTSKFTSAACAKVVRDQTRSTTPCGMMRSKLLSAKRCVADSTRKHGSVTFTSQDESHGD